MNIVSAILNHARTRPAAAALAENGCVLDYRELALAVTRTASHLRALGIGPGDRVGLCLKDTVEHIVTFLAVAYRGAAAISLDWRARPAEIAQIIDALGLKHLIATADARLPDGRDVILLDGSWRAAVALSDPIAETAADWQDPFTITASSGSTGRPKFVEFSHQQYFFLASGVLELLALSGSHRFLCTLPFCYASAPNRFIAHLLRGDCVVLYPSLFSAAEYIDVVQGLGATVGIVVPTTVRQLLDHFGDAPRLPGLAALFVTGAPLSPEEKLRASQILTPNFYDAFGTTEIGLLTVLRPSDIVARAGSVGQPHSLAEIQIVDDNDVPLPRNQIGWLRYRGPALSSPIITPDSSTQIHEFRGGWHYPGELAHLDNCCFLFLHGRGSDMINRGGAKFYPVEVENILHAHPGIIEAAVVGYRGDSSDDEVVAFVVARGEQRTGDLIGHCRMHLAAHKVPRRIQFVAALPKTASGKINKSALVDVLKSSG